MAFQQVQNSEINPPAGKCLTLKELNERNRQFWLEQSAFMEQRMTDQDVLRVAIRDLESEYVRRVPVYYQKSFAQALETAASNKTYFLERAANNFQIEFSRKGGAASKTDALQKLILKIVYRRPDITSPELLIELDSRRLEGIIEDIDHASGIIEFRSDNQNLKQARISGLKHRLSRAKKNYHPK